jgi:hypothetical protein
VARVRSLAGWAVRRTVPLAILAVLGFGAGATVAIVYGQFGSHPGRSADAWAARPAAFTGGASCVACHPEQATAHAASHHAGVDCESCHGPLDGHPAVNPTPLLLTPASSPEAQPVAAAGGPRTGTGGLLLGSAVVDTSAPSALCLTCHQAVFGRPLGFPAIDPATHYTGPACVACHDPHTAIAAQPPIVRHPLAGLPECTTCHSPRGMRPLPSAHPVWSGSCLACHKVLAS